MQKAQHVQQEFWERRETKNNSKFNDSLQVTDRLKSLRYFFLPLGVASCCASIQLVPYDSVARNKISIRQLAFIFLLTHYMFRLLRAILR
jgi:hypothetical protein